MSRRSLPGPPDEISQTRDRFVMVLGLCGLGWAVAFGYIASAGDAQRVADWAWAVPISGAISAVLASNLVLALTRRRPWSIVLLRFGLFGINAVLFVAELIALLVATNCAALT